VGKSSSIKLYNYLFTYLCFRTPHRSCRVRRRICSHHRNRNRHHTAVIAQATIVAAAAMVLLSAANSLLWLHVQNDFNGKLGFASEWWFALL
jgi:hypothetical protein